MKKILILDNYDSFTYNLYHLVFRVCGSGYEYLIKRNRDRALQDLPFDVLIISPGPMGPEQTGFLPRLFTDRILPGKIPVLGICLGMQFLAYYFGCPVQPSQYPVHGRRVNLQHNGEDLFASVPPEIMVARYNSLEVVTTGGSPLKVLAREKESNMIMAIRHNSLPLSGVQFHPESFLSESREQIIKNFMEKYVEA